MKDLYTEIYKASGNELEEATHKWEDTVWLWDGMIDECHTIQSDPWDLNGWCQN